jgi:isoamylase
VFLNGDALRELDDHGFPVRDDSFLLFFNAHDQPLTFTLPKASFGRSWNIIVNTALDSIVRGRSIKARQTIEVADRAVVVATRPTKPRRAGITPA